MKRIAVPGHWTPAQAEAVWDFLAQLLDAVWEAYEQPLVDAAIRELHAAAHDDRDDLDDRDDSSDIPF